MSLIEYPPDTHQPRDTRQSIRSYRIFYAIMVGLVAVSIAYYFLIALPRHNKSLLDFEREKFQAAQSEKQKKADAEAEERKRAESVKAKRKVWYTICSSRADDEYWDYVKLNGTPVEGKPGVYSAPHRIWDEAEKKKKAALEKCQKENED